MQPDAKRAVAFVIDALPGMFGGERVLLSALELFPGAPVYTLVYNPAAFAHTRMTAHPVVTSWINRLPMAQTRYRSYLPLMPLAVEQFDLRRFDLVISFNYAVAHGARTRPGQRHLSYTYTPLRYAWRNFPVSPAWSPSQKLAALLLRTFRKWDVSAAARVDHFAAVSQDIATWIGRVYRRDARVIYPPVNLERFRPQHPRDNFFITVSRLVAHKRIDLIVEAFSSLKLPLIIVGDGPEGDRLREMASPNIQFAGSLPDAAVASLLGRARAFVCAAEEDFGIAVVEAQASGCPVIAFGNGGALETVEAGRTGLFFGEQSKASLVDAVGRFLQQEGEFCADTLVSSAQRFGKERFLKEFAEFAGIPVSYFPSTIAVYSP